jgi:predicted nucleotidyltransferase
VLKNHNREKILRLFFDDPLSGYLLREISKKINLGPVSVKNYLKELQNAGLVKIKKHKALGYPVYYSNRDSDDFISSKKQDNLNRLYESGLVSYLEDKCAPFCLTVFGSYSKGQDVLGSDVDLFLLGRKKNLNLLKFEKKLNRKINILFTEHFNKLSKELKNNLINGSLLKGYLKVF